MIENAGSILIALWGIAIILGIATNTLKLRDRLFNWYKLYKKPRIIRKDYCNKTSSIKLLNFSHPITDAQKDKIENLLQKQVVEIIDLTIQLEESYSFQIQICELFDSAKIPSENLQKGEYIINLPGYAPAVAVLLAELHGRMGQFPTVIRMKKVIGSTPQIFYVEEIMNLQAIRDDARKCR